LGLGAFRRLRGTYNADKSARCMKTGTNYSVSTLLRMKPLAARGIRANDSSPKITINDTSRSLVRDANGNMVPDVPGATVPLTELPADHPAIFYLTQRGYTAAALVHQFGAAWCTQELPEDAAKGRFYKRFAHGFRDTPQNRIVLFIDIYGVRRGWQARYLEHSADGVKHVFHPYTSQWVAVARKIDDKWEPLPGFEKERFDLSKYKTAFGAKRNEVVMGLDAAVRWNTAMRPGKPALCVVSEGPLDAARFGAPGLAVLGKSLSDNQASLTKGIIICCGSISRRQS
jgi:hypothetical protein